MLPTVLPNWWNTTTNQSADEANGRPIKALPAGTVE